MKILTLSTCYPNPREHTPGTFIRSRAQAMALAAEVLVVAPVAAIRYSRRKRTGEADVPLPTSRRDDATWVRYPRWIYPPYGGALNSLCLFLRLAWPLRRLLQEFPFDVIDAHFAYPEGVAAAMLGGFLKRPFTVTLRGCEVDHCRHFFRRLSVRWALRRAARVIAVSDRLRKFALEMGVEPSRAVTIPNGVRADIFHSRDRAACRARFGVVDGEMLVASAGSLIELKGHDRTILALRTLRDRGLPARLIIAGENGAQAGALRATVDRLELAKHVHFAGCVTAPVMAELMCAADVFCLASRREGWPNVLHEALACGTPAVATDVGAVPALIASQAYGLIVPPNDSAALASALETALLAPWDRDAISAWGRARSWEQVGAEVVRELRAASV